MTLPKGYDRKKSSYSNTNRASNNKANIVRGQYVAGAIICFIFGLLMLVSVYSMTSAWTYVSYGPLIGGIGLCVIGFLFFLRGIIK